MRNQKIILIFIVLLSFSSCQYFEKDKKDSTIRNAGALLLLNKSKASNSSSCSGSSGMVICIPIGIAE